MFDSNGLGPLSRTDLIADVLSLRADAMTQGQSLPHTVEAKLGLTET